MSKTSITYDNINLILSSESAYPTTVYEDYPTEIAWTGTLSTTVSGLPTCSIAPDQDAGVKATFPSHPLLPAGVQDTGVNTTEDPRGWTYVPVDVIRFGDTDKIIDLFPDLGVWNCNVHGGGLQPQVIQGGPAALQTALYLTITSTSTHIESGAASAQAQAENTRSPHAYTEKEEPAETFKSQAPPVKLSSFTESVVPYPPPIKPSLDRLGSPTQPANVPAQITANDEIITPKPQSHYIVSGQTLLRGSSVTLGSGASATVLMLYISSGVTALVYGPRTSILSSPSNTTPQPLTIGTETITPNPQSQYIISGQTLSPGSSIILGSGASTTVLALHTSSGKTAFIYGTSTSLLATPNALAPLTIGS